MPENDQILKDFQSVMKNIPAILKENPIKPEEKWKTSKLFENDDSTVTLLQINSSLLPHYHKNSSETLYIIFGRGMLRVGDDTMEIVQGDCVHIPKKMEHYFRNIGSATVVALSIFTPVLDPKDRIFTQEEQ